MVHDLVHEMFAETGEKAMPADVRETVEAIQQMGPPAMADGDGVTIHQIAAKLASVGVALDRSSVQRRVRSAIELNFLLDKAGGGRGKAKQIVLGDWPGYDESIVPVHLFFGNLSPLSGDAPMSHLLHEPFEVIACPLVVATLT